MRGVAALALLALFGAHCARAEDRYPDHPITLVSPYTPGSGSDLTARALQPALQAELGQSIVVENRSGAGGAIGARYVARANPDGYTLLLGSVSFSILPAITEAGYDPVKDFASIILMGNQQMAVVVPPSLPVHSMRDLVPLAKAQPGRLNFSSAGVGSIGHLQWELFKQNYGLDMVHVPFSGTPQALSELIAARVQMSIISVPTAAPQVKAGLVRALAVQGSQRAPELPDVPTMAEAGYPELGDAVWYILMAPKGTPQPVIDKLNAAMRKALARPDARVALAGAGIVPASSTPAEAQRYLVEQVAKWQRVVKDSKTVSK